SRMAAVRRTGTTLKVNLALRDLPRFACLPDGTPTPFGATIHLLPGSQPGGSPLSAVRAMWEQVRAGRLPEEPTIEWYLHTTVDPSLRDAGGHHSSALFVQSVPYQPAGSTWEAEVDGYVARLLALCDRYAPGTSALVADAVPLTPPGLEARFGITGGHIHHVDNTVSFTDRMPYATGLDGLYAGSAGCHPAGSVIGAAGHNAARRILADLGLRRRGGPRSGPAGQPGSGAAAGVTTPRPGSRGGGRRRPVAPDAGVGRLGRTAAQRLADAGQAAAGAQVELPAVHLAGQRVTLDLGEARQVRLEVRAAALDVPVTEADLLVLHDPLVLVVPPLGVLQPLLRQALEERVDELVVLPDPGRGEAAGQEQRVAPVDLAGVEQVLHQGPPGPEAVAHLLVRVRPDLAGGEVDDDRLHRLPRLVGQVEPHR